MPESLPPVVENSGEENRSAVVSRPPSSKFARMLNNRPTMLVMLFGVTGFLGIPFLWKSNAFSRNEKIFWSAAVTAYTGFLLWATGAILWWCFSKMREMIVF